MKRTIVVVLAIAAAVLAAIAFLASEVSGFSAPGWVLPTAVLAVTFAFLVSLF